MDKETTIDNIINAYNSGLGGTIQEAMENNVDSIGILNHDKSILRVYANVTYHLRNNRVKKTDTIRIGGDLLFVHPVRFSGKVKKALKLLSDVLEGIDYHHPKPIYHKNMFVYFNPSKKE